MGAGRFSFNEGHAATPAFREGLRLPARYINSIRFSFGRNGRKLTVTPCCAERCGAAAPSLKEYSTVRQYEIGFPLRTSGNPGNVYNFDRNAVDCQAARGRNGAATTHCHWTGRPGRGAGRSGLPAALHRVAD